MKVAGWFSTALISLAAALPAAAGSFSVAPTRIEFPAGKRTTSVVLRNTDSKPLTLQVSLVQWTQSVEQDAYEPTRDLLITPPLFTIAPHSEQVVRIGLRRAPEESRELPYRIFFEEVPTPGAPYSANTLSVNLRVGVPVFVHAAKQDEGMYLDWQAQPAGNGEVIVSAENRGGTHVQVTGFKLLSDAGVIGTMDSGMRYVLPGNRVSWKVRLADGARIGSLRVDGVSDMGEFASDVSLANAPLPATQTAAR